jgi:hypothetical protein
MITKLNSRETELFRHPHQFGGMIGPLSEERKT